MSDKKRRFSNLHLEFLHKSNDAAGFSDAVADLACGVGVDYVVDYAYYVAKEGEDKELFFSLMNEFDESEFIDLFHEVVIKEIKGEFTGKALNTMKEYILKCRKEKSLYFDVANGKKSYENGEEISLLGYSVWKGRFDIAQYLFDLGANNMTYKEMIVVGNEIFVHDENKNFVVAFLLKYVIRFNRVVRIEELLRKCNNKVLIIPQLREFKEGLEEIAKNQFNKSQKENLIRDLLNEELKNNYISNEVAIENISEITTIALYILECVENKKDIEYLLKEEIENMLKLELNNDYLDFKMLIRVLQIAKATLTEYDFGIIINSKNDDNFNMLDVVYSKKNIDENDKGNYKAVVKFLIQNGIRLTSSCDNINDYVLRLKRYTNNINIDLNDEVGRKEIENIFKIVIDLEDIETLKECIKVYSNFCGVDCNNVEYASVLVENLNKKDLFKFRPELHKRGKYVLNLSKDIYITLVGNRNEEKEREIRSLIEECSEKLKRIHQVLKREFRERDLEDEYNGCIKMKNDYVKRRNMEITNTGLINMTRENFKERSFLGIRY